METIMLMADYQCFPLWWESGDNFGDIDPRTLPMSPELATDLLEWGDHFTSLLDMEDGANSGFDTIEEEEAFAQRGEALWRRLEAELRGKYQVIYRPFGQPYASLPPTYPAS